MPDVTVVSPAAVVPADRLTLGSCDARVDNGLAHNSTQPCGGYAVTCMVEE